MMTETVVHVTTLEQLMSVLDVWFKQGYRCLVGKTGYYEIYFTQDNSRYLDLDKGLITRYYSGSNQTPTHFIEYSEFMTQQKEDNKMATVYVTQEQLNLIEELSRKQKPLSAILTGVSGGGGELKNIHEDLQKQTLRYLGGDTSIQFKAKEQLYRLWRIDDGGNMVYVQINVLGTPTWTTNKHEAFTAPLDEITKWKTPAWEIEKAD